MKPRCPQCNNVGATYIPCPDCKGAGRVLREIFVIGYKRAKTISGVCFACCGKGEIEKLCPCRLGRPEGLFGVGKSQTHPRE
jgi:DnaJ-class molecular chaperone